VAKIISANVPRNTNGTITPHYSVADVPGGMHAVQPHVAPADATHAVLQYFALMAHCKVDFQGGKQAWCKICKVKKTTRYCVDCGYDMSVCSESVCPACLAAHKRDPKFRGKAKRVFKRRKQLGKKVTTTTDVVQIPV
jgi:hypothetical protein